MRIHPKLKTELDIKDSPAGVVGGDCAKNIGLFEDRTLTAEYWRILM